MSCADLRLEEFPYSYQERCNQLNSNPILVAQHVQCKFENFFNGIILDGPLGKTKSYALRIEFQEKCSPHGHLFIWIFNVPNIQIEDLYIEFIEKATTFQIIDHLNDPDLFGLGRTCQVHVHSRRMNVDSPMVEILLRRHICKTA